MQKFFTDTLESRYIKSLLYEAYLPNYNSILDGDIIVSGIRYIYKSLIIEGTKTGILGEDGRYTSIGKYDTLLINRKLNSNFLSKERYYDSDTHERLGKYLRYYRDFTGIDLMPLYNCYSNRYNNLLMITDKGIGAKLDSNIKVLEIPIKFNRTYTIAIDCNSFVYIAPAFVYKQDFLYSGSDNLTEILYSEEGNDYIKRYPSLQFSNPITYSISNGSAYLQEYEDNLVLLVQIPNYCDSSIVVLEGDYTNLCKKTISTEKLNLDSTQSENNGIGWLTTKEKNMLFLSDLSLLRMNDRNSYAFSDKLILYLLTHAITSRELIANNIERVQKDISIDEYETAIPDVWDDMLRKVLFDRYIKANPNGLDILGYVDNDVENFLLKIRNIN